MTDLSVDKERIIRKTLELLQNLSWASLTLTQIAQANNITPLELYQFFHSKGDILAGISTYITNQTIKSYTTTGIKLGSYEALFEAVLCRLEILNLYKSAFRSLENDCLKTPFSTLEAAPSICPLLRSMLSLAGISTKGVLGMIKVKAFAIVYALILHQWLEEKTDDFSKTMAMVDRLLKKIEPLLTRL